MRAYEALAAGALLLLEATNREAPQLLMAGEHYATYTDHDLEAVIEHYLMDEQARRYALQRHTLPLS